MAIKFKEIRRLLARNVRISISFTDGHYENYSLLSDIPKGRYDEMFVCGIGKIDVEFPMDVYTDASESFFMKDAFFAPALEILIWDSPRDDAPERKHEGVLRFADIKSYLQRFGHIVILNREDWSGEAFDRKNDISATYDDMYVYGIGMEDDPNPEREVNRFGESSDEKRMVVVVSETPRNDN